MTAVIQLLDRLIAYTRSVAMTSQAGKAKYKVVIKGPACCSSIEDGSNTFVCKRQIPVTVRKYHLSAAYNRSCKRHQPLSESK